MKKNNSKWKVDSLNPKDELHKKIWEIACGLRSSSANSWDFKSYILTTIFYKYLSQKLENSLKEDDDIDYSTIPDDVALNQKDAIISKYGFFMLPSELFRNVLEHAPDNPNLNKDLKRTFDNIENYVKNTEIFDNFKGLFKDFDFTKIISDNSNTKLINEKLVAILKGINDMQIGSIDKIDIDALGDAYEYLIGMYASTAGSKGGEFFTPQEVSELLMRLAISNFKDKTFEINDIYDPACGSGSLLLQALKLLGKDNFHELKGQEINQTTYNLCRMNMFLHGMNPESFHIVCDNTLTNPAFLNDVDNGKKFDIIVSNPPYSEPWNYNNDETLINDKRFSPAGVLAPKRYADFAFIMHIIHYLSEKGTACVVCFLGILHREHAEQKIRQYLVDHGFIDAIIKLPKNLFYGTHIPVAIMVLRKNRINSNQILFIDGSKFFKKGSNQNKLSKEDILEILKIYQQRENIPDLSINVSLSEIINKKYDLQVNTYIKKNETYTPPTEDQLNLLDEKIQKIVNRINELRKNIDELTKRVKN